MEANTKLLPIKTRNAINAFLADFPLSNARAQLINIRQYKLVDGETIAERIIRDHRASSGAYRAALLLAEAGAATLEVTTKQVHCGHGVYKDKETTAVIFEDGSVIQ